MALGQRDVVHLSPVQRRMTMATRGETKDKAADESIPCIMNQVTQMLGFCGPQAEELARRSSENLQAMTQASTVLARGAQEFSNEVFGLVQDRLTKNVEAVARFLGSRSVPDLLAIQGDLARDTVWQVLTTQKHMAELSLRITEEAVRAIQAQPNQSGTQIRRAA
jgi:phasin family protein